MTDKVYTCIGARNFEKTDRHKEDFMPLLGLSGKRAIKVSLK